MTGVLRIINEIMGQLNLNYEYMEWTSDITYPYFVGEYLQSPETTEDGLVESSFILTGFTRGTWLELEQAKERIEDFLRNGYRTTTDGQSGVVIFFDGCQPIRIEDAELKKIQINLIIKEWRVF